MLSNLSFTATLSKHKPLIFLEKVGGLWFLASGKGPYLLHTPLRLAIRRLVFTLVYGDDEHDDCVIHDLIDQAVTRTAQLDFIAVGQLAQAVGLDARD